MHTDFVPRAQNNERCQGRRYCGVWVWGGGEGVTPPPTIFKFKKLVKMENIWSK
jgi:hypothetical protein